MTALAAAGPLAGLATAAAAEPSPPRTTIGIQVGAVSFVDEGTDKVLDILQEPAAVDTIYLTTFTYGRGLAGRQIPGHRFPDHGDREIVAAVPCAYGMRKDGRKVLLLRVIWRAIRTGFG